MPDAHISRRTVLEAGGIGVIGAGLLGVAGCSASPSAGVSGGGQTSSAHSGPITLAKLTDVPVGGSAAATAQVDGKPVVLSQQTAGKVMAFSAICTHMGCTVNAGGPQFHCPCHGSIYNAFTGEVVRGPAPAALSPIPVSVSGGEIVTT